MQANIAFAYEPKFVLPGIGAVGIENTFVVKETGIEKITLFDETLRKL
jgi:Xaa-Pro aminopeptidase